MNLVDGQRWSPENFTSMQLLASDFDRTIARTDEVGPLNMNVERTTYCAVERILGPLALEQYVRDGGLNNRAPGQVVQSLAPTLLPEELQQVSSDFVAYKLSLSMQQIGTHLDDGSPWPRLVDGFATAWSDLQELGAEEPGVDTAIVSSGHDSFIMKVFEVHDLPLPDVLISEDTVRAEIPHEDYGAYVKPSPFLIGLTHRKWAECYSVPLSDSTTELCARTLYLGDDLVKDGGLAQNASVQFVHVSAQASRVAWEQALAIMQQRLVGVRHAEQE
jgi:hypothetical protein